MSHAHTNNSAAPSVGASSEPHAQRERWLWRLVRALHAWIIGIGWTDLGVAFALISIGADRIGDGFIWHGLWCWMLGIAIYVRAPRPNVKAEPRAKIGEANG